jgi:RNA recognition motif-containing protein
MESLQQITELFRQFAPVKSVFLVRDPASGMSRGIAFVEFFSVDYSTYALSNSTSLEADRSSLKVHYAKKAFLQSLPAFQQQQALLSQVSSFKCFGLLH